MAGQKIEIKKFFPLRKIDDVVGLFRAQLEKEDGPNLALLSVVVGYIENQLTCNRTLPQHVEISFADDDEMFPVVELATVEALYGKFESQIKGSIDLSQFKGRATRELVKKVSDVIWSSLTRSYYKDRAHLQSLYSYLTGNKLDCFGVAFSVVAACQVLRFGDVNLALSEDHAWVVFGREDDTAEVTWHGKGNEDKRGQPVTPLSSGKSWLYVNNHPVKCNRFIEVATVVSGMNPSINATTDSVELASLQQKLLWLLYDLGHLKKYPMALGNLGDLEEVAPTPGRPPPLDLFREAIRTAQTNYANHHVYPYTYLGGYLYRNGRYKEALEAWANAADVIRKYNYGREDEEIYKEFLEIANELIPHIIKVVSTTSRCEPSGLTDVPLLQDARCFSLLLRFYDGLCAWEEESSTPVLHIGWARPLVATISKFPAKIRGDVRIRIPSPPKEGGEEDRDKENEGAKKQQGAAVNGKGKQEFLQSLVTQLDPGSEAPHPNIATLAAACGDNILNPEYLLGSGEPFSADCRDLLTAQSNGTPFPGLTVDAILKADSPADLLQPAAAVELSGATVSLSSRKMAGLRELLLSEKLNTSAIQLQLTAQSQVQVVKRGRHAQELDFLPPGRTTKRSRRD